MQQRLRSRRHQNQGQKLLLDDLQLAMLWQRLQTPPPDGGLWNSRKVAEWMSELLERRVSKQRGWQYLRGYELRLKQPLLLLTQVQTPLSKKNGKKRCDPARVSREARTRTKKTQRAISTTMSGQSQRHSGTMEHG